MRFHVFISSWAPGDRFAANPDMADISIPVHPNVVGNKSIGVFHFVIEYLMDGAYDFDLRPGHSNAMTKQISCRPLAPAIPFPLVRNNLIRESRTWQMPFRAGHPIRRDSNASTA
jgi:hypothetical protein